MAARNNRTDWDDEGDEAWSSEEDGGEEEEGQDEPTIPCPYCRREIHEESSRCPYCEQYLSGEDAPPSRKPWWIVLGVVLCLYAIYRWITLQ